MAALGSAVVVGRGRVGHALRTLDQRAGVFALPGMTTMSPISAATGRARSERLDDFDVAVSTLNLHHWTDPAAVFAETARVLRPGGIVLIYDLRPFAYLRHELELFLAGTPLEHSQLERELLQLGRIPAPFVRIRLVKAPEA